MYLTLCALQLFILDPRDPRGYGPHDHHLMSEMIAASRNENAAFRVKNFFSANIRQWILTIGYARAVEEKFPSRIIPKNLRKLQNFFHLRYLVRYAG